MIPKEIGDHKNSNGKGIEGLDRGSTIEMIEGVRECMEVAQEAMEVAERGMTEAMVVMIAARNMHTADPARSITHALLNATHAKG